MSETTENPMNAGASELPGRSDMIERWRFDATREGATIALQIAGDLLRDAEQGNWLNETERYHKTMELVAVLAAALHKGTAP